MCGGLRASALPIWLSEIKDDDNIPSVHRSQDRLDEAQVHRVLRTRSLSLAQGDCSHMEMLAQ